MADVEIVKKGYLKYFIRSSSNPKPSWFVFRIGSSTSGRILDIFNTEKEGKKNALPKDRIYLREIHSVDINAQDNSKKQFILRPGDGSRNHILEALSEFDCIEWVFALNAVLFGKGSSGRNIIQFAVHINKCPLFGYHGYGILEVREDILIVWSQGESEEVVRWKLGHLRSFKAKIGVLEIIAGSRSATGEGVFMFGTQESVLITHTLETVIDRLARMKRAKNMKFQQALPPLPPSNHPSSIQTPPIPSLSSSFSAGNVLNATLVRGRTDTRNLVPGFSDIPDASVRLPGQSYPMRMGEPENKSSLPLNPTSQTYDTLNTGTWCKSASAGTLPLPRSPAGRDIYASEIDESRSNQRRTSRHSMKTFDYSYVETEPKCVLLSSTSEEALGEVRHTSSDKSKQPQSPTIITSDYFQVGDDMTYSSLNPVTSTNVLPQGLYNQLDYKPQDNQTDGLSESPPPPLPPPFVTTPPAKRGYENIGSRSPRRSVNSEGSLNGLTDSVNNSLELCMTGEESPCIVRKSPRPSPNQSPLPPRRIQDQYDQTVIEPNPNTYNKVQRTVSGQQQKTFQLNLSDDSTGAYSKLVSTPSIERKTINIESLSVEDDSNPYSQLSYKQTPPTENEPNQHASHEVNGESVYSKFTHNSVDDTTTQYNSTDIYSTLQSPSTPVKPAMPLPPTEISYEEVNYPSPPPINSYEEVNPIIQTGCNPYDEVDFIETTPPPSSKDVPISSIYDDPPAAETPKQSASLGLPPIPPRRGASMNNNRPQKPPPLKPKPYISKK